jgi:cellulose synthase/poly-beta-1,6-N-acetylglucosamine synthase-like glycosyltransferase
MNFAAYRYVCCVDGDTIYSGNALLDGMAIALKNPSEVIGVTSYFGTSRHPEAQVVGGRRAVDLNWLSALQNIDLMRSFLVNRLAFSAIGAMMCSPGAFAIWRKDLFTELGPFDPSFSCEDIEFTYRAHEHFRRLKRPYRIASLPRLVAMTEGPASIRDLIKQRARWQRVLVESVWAYRRMWFNSRYGSVGLVALPYNILFEALSPLMQALSLVLLLLLGWWGVLDPFAVTSMLVFTALIVAAPSMLAVLIDNRQHRDYRTRDLLTISLYSLLDLVLFKPIILIAGLKGSIDFLKGKKGWDKFERNVRATPGA